MSCAPGFPWASLPSLQVPAVPFPCDLCLPITAGVCCGVGEGDLLRVRNRALLCPEPGSGPVIQAIDGSPLQRKKGSSLIKTIGTSTENTFSGVHEVRFIAEKQRVAPSLCGQRVSFSVRVKIYPSPLHSFRPKGETPDLGGESQEHNLPSQERTSEPHERAGPGVERKAVPVPPGAHTGHLYSPRTSTVTHSSMKAWPALGWGQMRVFLRRNRAGFDLGAAHLRSSPEELIWESSFSKSRMP